MDREDFSPEKASEELANFPPEIRANIYRSTGLTAFCKEKFREARWRYEQSMALFRDLQNQKEQARIFLLQGSLERKARAWGSACEAYEAAQKIAENENDLSIQSQALSGLASIEIDHRRYGGARALYNQALLLAQLAANRSDQIQARLGLAVIDVKTRGESEHLEDTVRMLVSDLEDDSDAPSFDRGDLSR